MTRVDLGIPLILLLGFFGLLLLALGQTRTYTLSAVSRGVEIGFEGRNAWFIGPATVCVPRPSPLRGTPGTGDARCDPRRYE